METSVTGSIDEAGGVALLRDLARAICALTLVGRTSVISLPYPPVVQRALDRVVWACIGCGERPPSSVPELVAWCGERTVAQWPFPVPAGFLRPGSLLVDPQVRMPTRTCVELCADGSDDAPDQVAQQMIRQLSEPDGRQGSADSAASIDHMRGFLITHPVLDRVTTRKPRHMATWRRVHSFYTPVPTMHRFERYVATCQGCGLLARLDAEGRPAWCEGELCPRDAAVSDLVLADEVMLLCEPLRQFVALPGRTEQQLRTDLASFGIGCTLVDAVEGTLELSRPINGRRFVHVVDRMEPTLLAATAANWANSMVVVPDRLLAHNPAYRTAFTNATPPAAGIELMSVSELVARVDAVTKEERHA